MDYDIKRLIPVEQGLNINQYKLREYLFEFDSQTDLAARLRYLAIGLRLFDANNLSPDIFSAFHKVRHQRINQAIDLLNLLLFVAGSFLLFKSNFWGGLSQQGWGKACIWFAMSCWFVPAVILIYMKGVRRNFVHTMRVLTTSHYIVHLQDTPIEDIDAFEQLAQGLNKGIHHKLNKPIGQQGPTPNEADAKTNAPEPRKDLIVLEMKMGDKLVGDLLESSINVDDHKAISDTAANRITLEQSYTDSQFHHDLASISVQPNQFNGMPMRDVVEYFIVMCCSPCAQDIPQMSKQDFVTFLRVGFLGCPSGGKIGLDRFEPGATLDIFHRFKTFSIAESYDTKKGKSEKYLRLVTENFKGFDFDTHRKNFRSANKSRLPEVRKRYKNEIQFLQSLQK